MLSNWDWNFAENIVTFGKLFSKPSDTIGPESTRQFNIKILNVFNRRHIFCDGMNNFRPDTTVCAVYPSGRQIGDSYAAKADNEWTPIGRHKKQTDIGIRLRFKPCGDDIAMIAPGGREYPATWLKTAGPPGLLQSSNTTIGGH